MFQTRKLIPVSTYLSLALALNLSPIQILNASPTIIPTLPANKSQINGPVYSCTGGAYYGERIPLASCQDAAGEILATLPFSHRERLTFGDRRGTGGRGAVVWLPYISISADGGCALEIISSDASRADIASILQITQWAFNMINVCKINDEEVKGGIAENLGGYGILGLKLTKFSASNIACRATSKPVPADCEGLLNQMPATDLWRGFGPRGDTGVDVELPYIVGERKRCAITIDTTGPLDYEKWYMIWRQAVAVYKLCVLDRGTAGTAFALGLETKKIFVAVTDIS